MPKLRLFPNAAKTEYLKGAEEGDKAIIEEHFPGYSAFVRKELRRDGYEVETDEKADAPGDFGADELTDEQAAAAGKSFEAMPGFWEWYENPERPKK